MTDLHLYEKAAHILNVAIDATPSVIKTAYARAKAAAAHPLSVIHTAYDVLITATADHRKWVVRQYHTTMRMTTLMRQAREGIPLHKMTSAERREKMLSSAKTDVERAICGLHVAYGQY